MTWPTHYNGIELPTMLGAGTREQHIALCKVRALDYLPGDVQNALRSMTQDLMVHPETSRHPAIIGLTERAFMLGLAGEGVTADEARRWIEEIQ